MKSVKEGIVVAGRQDQENNLKQLYHRIQPSDVDKNSKETK